MTWWKTVLQHNVLSLVYHSGNSASLQEMRCKWYSDVPRHNNINSNNVTLYVRTPPTFLKICILLSPFTHLQGLKCNHMLKAPIVYCNLKCYMKLEQTVYFAGIQRIHIQNFLQKAQLVILFLKYLKYGLTFESIN